MRQGRASIRNESADRGRPAHSSQKQHPLAPLCSNHTTQISKLWNKYWQNISCTKNWISRKILQSSEFAFLLHKLWIITVKKVDFIISRRDSLRSKRQLTFTCCILWNQIWFNLQVSWRDLLHWEQFFVASMMMQKLCSKMKESKFLNFFVWLLIFKFQKTKIVQNKPSLTK